MFSSCSTWYNGFIPNNYVYNSDATFTRSMDDNAAVNFSLNGGNYNNGVWDQSDDECVEIPTPQQQYTTSSYRFHKTSSLSTTANEYDSFSATTKESINYDNNNNNMANETNNTNSLTNALPYPSNEINVTQNNNVNSNFHQFEHRLNENNIMCNSNSNCCNQTNNSFYQNNKEVNGNTINCIQTKIIDNQSKNVFNTNLNANLNSSDCNQNNNNFNQINKNFNQINKNVNQINKNFNQINNNCNQTINNCKQNSKIFNENNILFDYNNNYNQIEKICKQNNNDFNQNNNIMKCNEHFIANNKNFERHHPYHYNNQYNFVQQQQQHRIQQSPPYNRFNFINQQHNFLNSQSPYQTQSQMQPQAQPQLHHQIPVAQVHAQLHARAVKNSTPPPPLEYFTYETLAPYTSSTPHHTPAAIATADNATAPSPSRMFVNNYYANHNQVQSYAQQQQQHFNLQQKQQQQQKQQTLTPSIPCQGNKPWTYAYCYGYGAYSNQGPCQFTQIVDIEDFMNNEKRKERSRDAARCRRSRETEIFTEMAQVLPLKKEDVQQLDKASVMRIAIAYLKVRDMLKMFPRIQELLTDLEIPSDTTSKTNSENSDDSSNTTPNTSIDLNDSSTQSSHTSESESTKSVESKPTQQLLSAAAVVTPNGSGGAVEDFSLMLKHALDGFLIILSNDGDITYVSANIAVYLGLSQIDILGQQIWEYAHQCDHAELKEALNIKRKGLADKVQDENQLEEGISTDHRDLFVRLKCTLTSRGRSINIKSASYKVIHITGHLVANAKGDRVLVAMGRPIPHPSNIEIPLGTTTFLTKHSLDMKFTYVDDKLFNLLGYKPEDLLETSLFDCHHGIDSDSLMTTFKNVLSKGQGETSLYRFLGKYGGYCWIVTQATIVYDKLKPQSVVCVNFVISNLEKENEIYTLQQYEESQKLKEISATTTPTTNSNCKNNNNNKTEILNENKTKKEEINIIKDNKATEEIQKQIIITTDSTEATTKIENSTPPPTPLNNCNNNNNNNNSSKLNEDLNQLKTVIKKEQQIPPTVVNNNINKNNSNNNNNNKNQTQTPSIATAAITTPITATVAPINFIPLSIQQQPLPSLCPTTTVTHTIFSKPKTTPKLIANIDDKGPKTVTSSLILTNLPTTTSTQSIIQQQSLNVATRAQSVTATVFSPLPQPPPKLLPSTTATAAVLTQLPTQQQTEGGHQTETNASQQQDMNKGFLSFAEDATELTMLKEEPDDLNVHLVAANAVDACMPLDESGPLFGEILVGFGMGSYGNLLPDDINSLDSNTSSTEHNSNNGNINNQTILKTATTSLCHTNTCTSSSSASPIAYNGSAIAAATISNRQSSPSLLATSTTCATNSSNTTTLTANSTNIDPFINYRDESNDTNCSQHLLSPSVTSKSPEGSSLPSLCSPNSLSQEDEFSYYTMNVDDMDDLTMRAPYIPMNEQDDLPLLTSDDYMWSSGNAFTPDEFSLHAKDSDNGLHAMQINQSLNYQQQQFTQQQQQAQQQYSNSLCSSPASTVSSSMSPSPIQQQQHQHQQQQQQLFTSDSSELAALLCGSANGTLSSLLQDTTNFTNSLNLDADSSGGGGGGGAGGSTVTVGNNTNTAGQNSVGLNDDLVDSSSVSLSIRSNATLDQHQQFHQQCLQQFQEQLQQQRQREQQEQELLSGLNINCKKEKFDTANNSPSMTPHLCDTIDDAFDNVVYSKNSTNLDYWNEFLQINTNETNNDTRNNVAATTQQQQDMEISRQEDCKQQLHMQLQQQQQQTQNIIINAVPLITFQTTTTSNNKNNILMPTPLNSNTNPEQHHQLQQQQPQSNTKLLNKVNTIKLTPITSTATIKIIENKQSSLQQQQQQNLIKTAYIQTAAGSAAIQTPSNNKRHLSGAQIANNALESKRLKSNNNMDSATSQLLQQLMTTPQQGGNLNGKNFKNIATDSKWSAASENQNQQQRQQQQQKQQQQKQSNSVLKNLLISGCDVSAGYCIVPMRPKTKLAKV